MKTNSNKFVNAKRKWSNFAISAFLIAPMAAFAQAPLTVPTTSPPAFISKLVSDDHPLAGKIWDSKQKKWVTEADLKATVLRHRFVLLGETHDNHQHHARHLLILNWLVANKQKPALVMEQFDVEHQAAINAAIAAGKSSDDIADTAKLNRRGWQWPQYQSLVNVALSNKLPIVAANLSRADARIVFSMGFSAVPEPALPTQFKSTIFDATWNKQRQAAVIETMVASHCGQLPATRAPGMVNAQRARDAVMANALLSHRATGAVLIAGRGHVRYDIGVPLYLKKMDANAKILSVGFVEVEDDKKSPETAADTYAELASADKASAPFDYVWFSARQVRPDPCEGMTLGTLVAPTAPTTPPAKVPSK